MRQKCPFSSLLLSFLLAVLANVKRQAKEIKGINLENEELKLSLFTNDIIFYVNDPKNSTKCLLEYVNLAVTE